MSHDDKTKEAVDQTLQFIKTLNPKPTIITGSQSPRPWRGPTHPGPDYEDKGLIFIDYTTNILS
jgi:hypothetical protein